MAKRRLIEEAEETTNSEILGWLNFRFKAEGRILSFDKGIPLIKGRELDEALYALLQRKPEAVDGISSRLITSFYDCSTETKGELDLGL